MQRRESKSLHGGRMVKDPHKMTYVPVVQVRKFMPDDGNGMLHVQ